MKRRMRFKPVFINRLAAVALVTLSMVPVWVLDDYTALIIFGFFALTLWFQKEDLRYY